MKTAKVPGRVYLQPETSWESRFIDELLGPDAPKGGNGAMTWWTDDVVDVDGLDDPLTTDAHRVLVVSTSRSFALEASTLRFDDE